MATLRNQKFSWDNDDLNPKCKAVLDLLNDLVTHFRYLMEDTQSPLPKGHSKPCAKAIAKVTSDKNQNIQNHFFFKVEESLQMFNDVTNNVIIPAAGAKSSENLKLEIIRTLEQLNYQGNCH